MTWTEGWEKDWGDDANYPYDPEQAAIDARRKIVREQRNAYEETIRAEERERIIKLLEGIRADAFQWDELGVMTKGYDIALDAIKGEQK